MPKPDPEPSPLALDALVDEPSTEAGRSADGDDWARRLGVARSVLDAEVARHFHTTPDAWLDARRHERARVGLRDGATEEEAGRRAGWGTSSAWRTGFRRRYLITPGSYRTLRGASGFAFQVPTWLNCEPLWGYLGRDPQSASEQVKGRRFRFSATVADQPVGVTVSMVGAVGQVELASVRGASERLPANAAWTIHDILCRLLGAHLDPRPFEGRSANDPALRALVAEQRGLAISQTRDLFDALLWVVAGQQVSLPVAFALRRRLTRRVGARIDETLFAPPTPSAVAGMDVASLRRLGFSFRKAEYLLGIARAAVEGTLDLRTENRSAVEVAATLGAVRGLGPWSVGYLLMRAFSFADCVPVGDAALVRKLMGFFRLDQRPNAAETVALMAPFAPFRSLATFYLWALPEYR